MEEEPRLSPEDQAKVDKFTSTGINAVERKPFKPLRLLAFLVVIVTAMSVLSIVLARWSGVY